jgi:hypothetical protein
MIMMKTRARYVLVRNDADDDGKGKVSHSGKCGCKGKGGKYHCVNHDVSLSLTFYLLQSNTASWYCTLAKQ